MHFGSQLSARNKKRKEELRRTKIKVIDPKSLSKSKKKEKQKKQL
jgi:hypothetical protein